MKGDIRISVVVPVYNVEPYIVDCLESVGRQTTGDGVECIIVDDCGGDRSMALAEAFVEAYKGEVTFRTIHHERNRGLSAARNTGVEAARGKYVYFLDSDDWITTDCLHRLYEAAESTQAEVAIADFSVVGAADSYTHLRLADGRMLRDGEVMHEYAMRSWYQMAWNKLLRRDYLQRVNLSFREGIVYEDELWSYEMACTARSMIAVRRKTYVYRLRSGSITIKGDGRRELDGYPVIVEGMATRVRNSALQSSRDACLRYYTAQHAFLLKITSVDASFVGECYARMARVCPFSAWRELLAAVAYPRLMINAVLGIKAIGCGCGNLWIRLRNILKK